MNRRRNAMMASGGGAASADVNFESVLNGVTSNATVGYWRGDLGKTKTGSVVNTWANQSVHASKFGDMTEGTGGVGIANDTGSVGGRVTVVSNGTTQFGKIVSVPQPLAAPATTPLSYYVVFRALSAPGGNAVYLGPGVNFALLVTTGLVLQQYNGTGQNAGTMVAGTWYRAVGAFGGSVADSTKLGSAATVTGINTGNSVGGSSPIGFGADPGGGFGFLAHETALILISRAPVATMVAAIPTVDASVAAYYSGLIQV